MNPIRNNMNPMQMIAQLQNSKNPMQMMKNILGGNPLFQRAMQMADGKNPRELQNIAKNLCEQRGIDFDQAVSQIQNLGVKIPVNNGK